MIYTGLVSVTFRKLKAEEIIELSARAGLQGIEWGGDIHVPHGDISAARKIGKATLDAGLKVASYGSYYKVGSSENVDQAFMPVLTTASALGAPNIRVWAGNLPSSAADEEVWKRIVEESIYIAELAKQQGISVSYEYHNNTLTDTNESALRLLREVDHPNIFSYWQPPTELAFAERKRGLQTIKPWISNLHVFYWEKHEHMELSKGISEWNSYMEEIRDVPGERYALLEFVKDDAPEQLLEDAEALKRIVNRNMFSGRIETV
jgi:sugar phosphate isomerase/epimerase